MAISLETKERMFWGDEYNENHPEYHIITLLANREFFYSLPSRLRSNGLELHTLNGIEITGADLERNMDFARYRWLDIVLYINRPMTVFPDHSAFIYQQGQPKMLI
ncbi:MAG: hypothetical protein AABX59_03445, partial [Nanoarchaeota archaeon]